MRIRRLATTRFPPIEKLEIADLSSPVIIAGANGSGKTRLKEAITSTFRSPSSPQVSLTLESTREQEAAAWGGDTLDVVQGTACSPLQNYMNSRTRGGTYVGTVIQIDSDRSVQTVQFQPITLATPDPYDAETDLLYYLSPFRNRWPELVNKIYQRMASRDHQIANFAKSNPGKSCQDCLDAYPDPSIAYQEIFKKLLPGKTLEPIDPRQPREFHYKIGEVGPLAFQTLSAGEQEVVKVAFDLVWKRIRHSVILIDEPELHLHPVLAFRLIETLKTLGDGTNQVILFTHSADLISTYYSTGNVYFIDLASVQGENQAKKLSDLLQEHPEAARTVGANLGLFAVGKKLVFIEGTEASVDRLTYHKVAQVCFPEAYFLPLGSVKNINSLREVAAELGKAIFGVNLYMVRDRDGLLDDQVSILEGNPRFRVLPRRQIENYFLDVDVLSRVAQHFYLSSEKADKAGIEAELLDAARACLHPAIVSDVQEFVYLSASVDVPKVKSSDLLDLDSLVAMVVKQLAQSAKSVAARFSEAEVETHIKRQRAMLEAALKDGSWKHIFPGKAVLARFVASFWGEDMGHVRHAYVDLALKEKPEVLSDIRTILEDFAELG